MKGQYKYYEGEFTNVTGKTTQFYLKAEDDYKAFQKLYRYIEENSEEDVDYNSLSIINLKNSTYYNQHRSYINI